MQLSYILITAAYNEESYIEQTIKSVISQTVLPEKWIIVSDGSTDRTDEIIIDYAKHHTFIEYLRIDSDNTRNFQSKVYAIRAGYNKIKTIPSDFIGNLDADIILVPDYYEQLIKQFSLYKNLGITAGTFFEKKYGYTKKYVFPKHHTPGSIQLFRRQCFEQIGGYPLLNGGEDSAAEIKARMYGWETASIPSIAVEHCKPIGTSENSSILKYQFRLGEIDYNLGMHPLFAFIKFLRRLFNQPYITGAVALFSGFLFRYIKHEKRPVPDDFIRFFRKEQMKRIYRLINLRREKT